MFLLKQAYAQRRQGSEHGPWDTERHRSTGPSSHGRHRTWHYSLRRGFGDRVCLGPIWWDEPIHVHLSCIYMYMHVEIHTRVLRNIIHIYIYTYLSTLQISTVKPMCLGWLGLKLHPACFLSLGGTGVWAHFVEVEASTFGMQKHGPTDQKMG
jgi:hypothetical protein